MLLLGDVQSGAESSRLKNITEEPERSTVAYAVDDREHVADIYQPGDREPRGTLVLIHGFTEHGRHDPRLVEFATSMARAGFTVVAPDVEGPMTMAVGLRDARHIQDTLEYVAADEDDFATEPMGLMAFSFAVGPAVIAAKSPDVAEDVAFLVAVGGYYDIEHAITYVTTGVDPLSGRRDTVPQPRREGKWVVLLSQLDRIEDTHDRELLREIAEARLEDPGAQVDSQVDALGEDGRAVYGLITNTDPDRVGEYLEALPATVRDELHGLDLARRDLSQLRAELVLVHGTDDNVIPIGHSERLQAAVGEEQAHLYPAAGLYHVDVTPGLRDGWQLWRASRLVLRLADQH
ncbi:Lysophospholipase, alpha-beta hydrolase superfamily [Aquisalimonas asiatica]|uniref:Lysophospholipase, alpha-beta hydrolase superfamily n=2 Tax=Aquisalimonas asiatica TaxID=406100 RepID=A0A1H8VGX5_9GAMM|nr:Lysophospholipase, alpha-beta hydrolase superfamily [Aquisalimonas asiatica]